MRSNKENMDLPDKAIEEEILEYSPDGFFLVACNKNGVIVLKNTKSKHMQFINNFLHRKIDELLD